MTDEQFKALKAKWEAVLERDGLGDIEKCGKLRVYASHRLNSTEGGQLIFHPDKNAAKESYYQLAGDFLNAHHFGSRQEKRIWALHSQGLTVREIAKLIHQPRNYSRINRKIVRLRKLMLARTSLP